MTDHNPGPGGQEAWRSPSTGSRRGLAALEWLFARVPLRVGYVLTLPMVVFWFMHYNVQRLSVVRALARFGVARPTLGSLRLFLNYAFTLVDRHYWLAGRLQPQMEPTDRAFLRQVFDEPGPLVVLGSHCGALEMAVPVLESRGRTIRAVARADPGADALLQGVGDAARSVGQGAAPIIADGSMEVGLEILRSLRAGEVLTFKSDRVLPGSSPASCVSVSLAGDEALLPRGPADVVRMAKARALALYVFRVAPGRFHVEALLLDTEGRSSEELLQDYADCLEDVVRRFPRQWFNFYPYWPSDAVALADRPATVPPVMRAARYGLRAALLAAMGGAGCAAVLADSALWAFPVAARAVGLAVLAGGAVVLVGAALGADVDRSGRRNAAAWLVSLLAPALVVAALASGLAGTPLLWRAAPIPLVFAAGLGLLGALRWRLP